MLDSWETPTAVVIAQDEARARPVLAALTRTDMRCRGVKSFQSAELALTEPPGDVLLIQATGAEQDQLWRFLHHLGDHEQRWLTPVVAVVTLDQLDLVASALFNLGADILCDATDEEIARAVRDRVAAPMRALHDSSSYAAKLLQVRGEVDRIAGALRHITQGETEPAPSLVTATMVKHAIWKRRLREQFFDSRLFADPAWDMLLDLFLGDLEGRSICVSSLCIAAATPPTTALRWIGNMTHAGILVREADQADKRRHYLKLSEDARQAMLAYFTALAQRAQP